MTVTGDERPISLGHGGARQLANATKTTAQMATITPRWLTRLLPWVPVEAGVYRLNKVRSPETVVVAHTEHDESELPPTFVDYEDQPREYILHSVSAMVSVHTRVADLHGSPHDHTGEQLRLTIEAVRERQETELISNAEYGLLANVADEQRVRPLDGVPAPDDLDVLLTRVWKEPAFFLAHPQAIGAFGRECTRRGVPPAIVSLFGSQFITWRGIPLIPTDKVPLRDGKTSILLLRVGDERRGVVGLYQPGLPFEPGLNVEQERGLSVRLMGVSRNAIASYLISQYSSLAVLADDALAVLDDVEVDRFHDYGHVYR